MSYKQCSAWQTYHGNRTKSGQRRMEELYRDSVRVVRGDITT